MMCGLWSTQQFDNINTHLTVIYYITMSSLGKISLYNNIIYDMGIVFM